MAELSWRVLARFITQEGQTVIQQLQGGLKDLELTEELFGRLQAILIEWCDTDQKVITPVQVSLYVPLVYIAGENTGAWGFFHLVRRGTEPLVEVDVFLYPEL